MVALQPTGQAGAVTLLLGRNNSPGTALLLPPGVTEWVNSDNGQFSCNGPDLAAKRRNGGSGSAQEAGEGLGENVWSGR